MKAQAGALRALQQDPLDGGPPTRTKRSYSGAM